MVVLIPFCIPVISMVAALPPAEGSITDAQAQALGQEALASSDRKLQAATLKLLQSHHFKGTLAKEREISLYAQGLLEDRLGQPSRAAATFHRLEEAWPRSSFLPEGEVIMAQAAMEHKRNTEAESRLRKALGAELPAETVRRCQELLLWCLADQGKADQGVEIVKGLKPKGSARPTEEAFVGIMEAYCAGGLREGAQSTLTQYHKAYPKGARLHRVDLDWAKLLGVLGDSAGAAQAFQKVIQTGFDAPEADEARLALATLLTDGRLNPKEAQGFPAPNSLVTGMPKAGMKEGQARQATLVRLRVAVRDHQWKEALDTAGQLRSLHPTESETLLVTQLRTDAMRGWTQELLDKSQAAPILPFLDGEGIRSLTAPQRLALAKRLAQSGLPEASSALATAAPAAERAALRRAALQSTASSNPKGTLGLMDAGKAAPQDSLMRAQAQAGLGDWPETRSALAKAQAGPERIQTILTLLHRPADPKEAPGARLKEAEGWLARAPEKGAVREPLLLFVADLKARSGDWKGALALYPGSAQPANRGWVALMRATCLARLGQKGKALDILKGASGESAYKADREVLAKHLEQGIQ